MESGSSSIRFPLKLSRVRFSKSKMAPGTLLSLLFARKSLMLGSFGSKGTSWVTMGIGARVEIGTIVSLDID